MASPVTGNMNQIRRCDWLPKWARWRYPALLALRTVSPNKNHSEIGSPKLSFVICALKNDFPWQLKDFLRFCIVENQKTVSVIENENNEIKTKQLTGFPFSRSEINKHKDLVFFLVFCTVFLSSFSINLLAFYHECRSLIGYATRYLFCDR